MSHGFFSSAVFARASVGLLAATLAAASWAAPVRRVATPPVAISTPVIVVITSPSAVTVHSPLVTCNNGGNSSASRC